jgi:hypothetical protein
LTDEDGNAIALGDPRDRRARACVRRQAKRRPPRAVGRAPSKRRSVLVAADGDEPIANDDYPADLVAPDARCGLGSPPAADLGSEDSDVRARRRDDHKLAPECNGARTAVSGPMIGMGAAAPNEFPSGLLRATARPSGA